MICPFCGFKNIPGTDECDSCKEDLSSLDGLVPKTRVEKVLLEDPVSKMKPREAIVVSEEASVLEAVRTMNQAKVGCVLVTRKESLEGILTERDIVFKAVGKERDLSQVRVREIMTPHPDTLSEDDSLAYAVNKMSVGGFRHVPILSSGKPAGVISVRDVLRYLSKLFP